ncbi:hypothetical protein CEXT_237101 [Caerostris extrusa]|uniref:Uncharacterized protein n=1 Tax=Caerostris extrusa TaxID=172846 RepID=A0AAV4U0X7_CAEEX|nr:hypothetical protein CEXT_237101 [Caerostris extrusa]
MQPLMITVIQRTKIFFTNTNLKGQNFGGNTGDYKGTRELDDKSNVPYEPQYDEISFKNGNAYPNNYKSSKGFNDSPNTGIIYEPRDFKNDHSQAPVYKENTKSFANFPRKTDSVSHVYFEMGHSKIMA